jgi:hypothetical protein
LRKPQLDVYSFSIADITLSPTSPPSRGRGLTFLLFDGGGIEGEGGG